MLAFAPLYSPARWLRRNLIMFTKLEKTSLFLPLCILILEIVCWIEVDLYAPSFPLMRQHFSTTEEMIQLSLSINFFGFFLSSLFVGPLSDSLGRRPVLLWGSLLFVLGSLICVWAPSIELLLLGRLIQGLGVAAPATVAVAIICDIYEGERQLKLMSLINSTVSIAMALAPIAGAYIAEAFGWRANFTLIWLGGLLGMLLCYALLPESHEPEKRKPLEIGELARGYATLIKDKLFMSTTLGLVFLITPYFIFIAIIPFLFMEKLKLPLSQYVYYQGVVVFLFATLSLIVPLLIGKFDTNRTTIKSICLSMVAATALCLHGYLLPDSAPGITVIMCVLTASMVWPVSFLFTAAINFFPRLRGSAVALFQAIRLLVLSGSVSLAGYLYDGTFKHVSLFILLLITLGAPLIAYAIHLQEKQQAPSDGAGQPSQHFAAGIH
jgi:DHA1 family bicyclomycin/chloramphenicol resistance-like MFS transporter